MLRCSRKNSPKKELRGAHFLYPFFWYIVNLISNPLVVYIQKRKIQFRSQIKFVSSSFCHNRMVYSYRGHGIHYFIREEKKVRSWETYDDGVWSGGEIYLSSFLGAYVLGNMNIRQYINNKCGHFARFTGLIFKEFRFLCIF